MSERKPELNEALIRALHEMGEPATPEQLSASGVTRVRRVSREMVSKLIEKAVNRTLMERTIGVSHPEMRELVSRAHAEFYRIVGQQDEIDRTREQVGEQRIALKEELARIRAELAARRGFVETQLERSRDVLEDQENEHLAARLREAFAALAEDSPAMHRLEREVVVRALEALELARGSAFRAGGEQANAEVQLLERRVAKLVQSLETTEQALRRVSSNAQLDQGIESVYRTVQGLDASEAEADYKRALMAAIFEKNLELHRRFKESRHAETGV